MQLDKIPAWLAIAKPIFGSEEGGEAGGEQPAEKTENKVGTGEKDDGKKTVEEQGNPQLDPDQIAKLIRENQDSKAQLSAFQQEKEEREAADLELQRANATKEENLERDNQALKEENEQLRTVNERNLLELAILKNAKYQWHNADDVSKMIDRSGIKINVKSGEVEGIEDALKSLAKEKPYMLKKDEQNGDNGSSQGKPPGQASGGLPGSSRDASGKANKRKALEDRFPVLRA